MPLPPPYTPLLIPSHHQLIRGSNSSVAVVLVPGSSLVYVWSIIRVPCPLNVPATGVMTCLCEESLNFSAGSQGTSGRRTTVS